MPNPVTPYVGKAMSLVARIAPIVATAAIVSLVLLGGVFHLFRNPTTPPGYVGYVTRGALVGKVQFYGLQTGPTSSGLGWLLERHQCISHALYLYREFYGRKFGAFRRQP